MAQAMEKEDIQKKITGQGFFDNEIQKEQNKGEKRKRQLYSKIVR